MKLPVPENDYKKALVAAAKKPMRRVPLKQGRKLVAEHCPADVRPQFLAEFLLARAIESGSEKIVLVYGPVSRYEFDTCALARNFGKRWSLGLELFGNQLTAQVPGTFHDTTHDIMVQVPRSLPAKPERSTARGGNLIELKPRSRSAA